MTGFPKEKPLRGGASGRPGRVPSQACLAGRSRQVLSGHSAGRTPAGSPTAAGAVIESRPAPACVGVRTSGREPRRRVRSRGDVDHAVGARRRHTCPHLGADARHAGGCGAGQARRRSAKFSATAALADPPGSGLQSPASTDGVVRIRRDRDRGQDADDRNHDHQFDQGETLCADFILNLLG